MFEINSSPCSADIRILTHHIYEYNKGLRQLALQTMNISDQYDAESILQRRKIPYYIQKVSLQKINIFLGNKDCIQIIKSFKKSSLSDFTPEQDFMLGIMLGYDRKQQFERYIKYSKKEKADKI